jgi:hypothetical protein
MNGIARAGLVPGVDISVTGYDDLEEAAIATPALTTVWNGQREVGRRAARASTSQRQTVRPSQELIKPELHVGSTGVVERTTKPNSSRSPFWCRPFLTTRSAADRTFQRARIERRSVAGYRRDAPDGAWHCAFAA